ncbi:MAG: uncharacterized protein QOG91_678 [Candidatus Parcubacteria bacterium]|nr:uncharacterized protein [Candidatus Parcubacteria bacterium]
MNPLSALQQQFPLSPKKFWKKIIEKLLGWYILVSIGIVIDIFIMIVTSGAADAGATTAVLWGTLVAVLIFTAIITGIYSWYIKVYIRRYYYDGEENFITIKKGVFAPAEIHVQWQKIQDVYVDQDILDRIMGLYDVHIASATAASGIEAHIDGVEQAAADGLKKFLLGKVSAAGRNSYQNETRPPAMAASTSPAGVGGQPPPPAAIHLSEEISSKVYPLTGKWLAIKVVGRLVSPFVYWAIVVFFIFGKLARDLSADYNWVNHYGIYIAGYLGVSVVSGIIHVIALLIWKKNYAFDFTPDNIYYREGVISLSEKHMPYSSIQDVTVTQGVLERLVGLARVRIENAAQQTMVTSRGNSLSVFTGVLLQGISLADANKITEILKTTVLGKNTSRHGL